MGEWSWQRVFLLGLLVTAGTVLAMTGHDVPSAMLIGAAVGGTALPATKVIP